MFKCSDLELISPGMFCVVLDLRKDIPASGVHPDEHYCHSFRYRLDLNQYFVAAKSILETLNCLPFQGESVKCKIVNTFGTRAGGFGMTSGSSAPTVGIIPPTALGGKVIATQALVTERIRLEYSSHMYLLDYWSTRPGRTKPHHLSSAREYLRHPKMRQRTDLGKVSPVRDTLTIL